MQFTQGTGGVGMSLSSKIRGLREVWNFDNRLWLIFTKVFCRHETLHIYRYKGIEILVDHAGGDANGAREVLLSPMYKRFLPKMKIDAPANVLDMGANNGGFPLLLFANSLDLKKVVSVELNPQTYTRLHFNLKRNLPCEVVPVNAALCGEERQVEVFLGRGSVSDSIYTQSKRADAKPYRVRGRTLDAFCNEHFPNELIDICKIDVEGAEFEVFLGDHYRSLRRCRFVIMEIHERDGQSPEEIIRAVEALGLVRQETERGADPTVHFFVNSAFT